jgi:hypothetical protein
MSMLAGDCSYGAADGGGRLCVPRFCEPPPAIKAAPWAQMNANYLNVPRVYNFTRRPGLMVSCGAHSSRLAPIGTIKGSIWRRSARASACRQISPRVRARRVPISRFRARRYRSFCSRSVGALTSLARDTRVRARDPPMAAAPSLVAQELAEVRDLNELAAESG